MRLNRLHIRAVLLFLISAVAVGFWVLSYDTTDTVTYHGTKPNCYGISADHGLLRVEKSTRTTDSDRHLRFWHGRAPIESSTGFAGFDFRHFRSGSWSTSAPLWCVALVFAALGAASLRRSSRAQRIIDAESEVAGG